MNYTFDIKPLMQQLNSISSENRLEYYLGALGVEFYEKGLIKESSAKLIAIGGIPISALDMNKIPQLTKNYLGIVSSQSYLSYTDEAYDKIVVGYGHTSSMHTVSVSLVIAGISCAVENEFNTQRDLVHLARITEARTAIQDEPPYVVPHCEMLDDFRDMRNTAIKLRSKYGKLKRDDRLEAINLIHSKASATSIIVTGSLKNFQKLFQAINDDGKEAEYKKALIKMKTILSYYWGELF
jgi:hypothetical protein